LAARRQNAKGAKGATPKARAQAKAPVATPAGPAQTTGVSSGEGVRLAELMAALSVATDLHTGAGLEHAQRSAILSARLAEAAGLSESDARDAYYLALLKAVGCTGDHDYAFGALGEDMGQWAGTFGMASTLEMLKAMARNVGRGQRPWQRAARVAGAVAALPGIIGQTRSYSELGLMLGRNLGLPASVVSGLGQVFEHWDGSGAPRGLKGEAIALPVRVAQLSADMVTAGREGAVELARRRSGKGYDPKLVERFIARASKLMAGIEGPSMWEAALAAEPGKPERLTGEALDSAVRAMGEYADLKSRFLHGHSSSVAELAGEAAQRLGLPEAEVRDTRRAGHLHDLGRVAVLARIWDKAGELTESERERVRTHSKYTEQILSRLSGLGPAREVAALAHERGDGSGYHRSLPRPSVPMSARALAAADVYHAMVSDRPYRRAGGPEAAATELRRQAGTGALDIAAVEAVVLSGSYVATQRRTRRVEGLSEGQQQVLCLLARGLSNKEIAAQLGTPVKAAGRQVEEVFEKIGVSTRPAATLFAMRHDLLG
jgi:HD-GYP domain-containing protein (c-di-GMP phosphodiesterase class II)